MKDRRETRRGPWALWQILDQKDALLAGMTAEVAANTRSPVDDFGHRMVATGGETMGKKVQLRPTLPLRIKVKREEELGAT